jgi:hypothetical protein
MIRERGMAGDGRPPRGQVGRHALRARDSGEQVGARGGGRGRAREVDEAGGNAPDAEDPVRPEAPRQRLHRRPRVVFVLAAHRDEVGAGEGRGPLAQQARGQRTRAEVARVHAHDVEVAQEPQVLEPVVEHEHARAERRLQGAAGGDAVASHRHHHSGEGPREHHGLVPRLRDVRRHAHAVPDDEDVAAERSTVPAAEDGHGTSRVAQHRGRQLDEGSLAPAAHGEVADADDGRA